MPRKLLALAAAVATVLATPAFAHHSFSMFATDKTVALKGVVKEFEWSNPHSWLHLTVMTADGGVQNWAFEMASPAQLAARGGMKPDSLKPGQEVVVQMHPLKDGSHGGSYVAVKLPDGSTMGNWQASLNP